MSEISEDDAKILETVLAEWRAGSAASFHDTGNLLAMIERLRAPLDPSSAPSEEKLSAALADALNWAFGEFCADTGAYPECFTITGARANHRLEADFRRSKLTDYAAGHLLAKHPAIFAARSPDREAGSGTAMVSPHDCEECAGTGWYTHEGQSHKCYHCGPWTDRASSHPVPSEGGGE